MKTNKTAPQKAMADNRSFSGLNRIYPIGWPHSSPQQTNQGGSKYMNFLNKLLTMFSLMVALTFSSQIYGQTLELNPYIGGVLGTNSLDFEEGSFGFKEQGLYGVRVGLFLTERVEVEGNFGYLNHMELEGSDTTARGYLWDVSGNYRFDLEGLKPLVSFGLGGLTTSVNEAESTFINAATPVFESGDTFFNLSYGGGVKAPMLWGPLGLRADIRGRTFPNMAGEALTWLEVGGGLTLTFGN